MAPASSFSYNWQWTKCCCIMFQLILILMFCQSTVTGFQSSSSSFSSSRQQQQPLMTRQYVPTMLPHNHDNFHPRRKRRILIVQKLTPTDAFFVQDVSSVISSSTTTEILSNNVAAAVTSAVSSAFGNAIWNNPLFGQFQDAGTQLSDSLDIGRTLFQDSSPPLGLNGEIPQEETIEVLGSIGQDLLVFLTASVVVTTVCNAIGITPILGYLVVGAILGPNGLEIFSNAQAGVELGDFGILFLLFSEGLEVTSTRLEKLVSFIRLASAQVTVTTGVITATLLGIGYYIPNNDGFLGIRDPVLAVILAMAVTLSTSAFIFPVLKEKGWEEEKSGEAATTILLLQDLLVAPLLVLLPYLVLDGPTDFTAIGFLTAKATIGFGSVLVLSSTVLGFVFRSVAQTRSSETFVALCLLVAAGMGEIAKTLGLTDTAGAFAAGVLLANTNYRAQIQADILPFKGILLGIFFMDAGSNFDLSLVMREWPVVVGGSILLLVIKAMTLFAATKVPKQFEPARLPTIDAIRVSILLAGGGEFAFVVLAASEKLGMIDDYCIKLLTAIILVTMGVTPLLGDLATTLSEPFLVEEEQEQKQKQKKLSSSNGQSSAGVVVGEILNGRVVAAAENEITTVAENSIVICGHGETGRAVLRILGDQQSKSDIPPQQETSSTSTTTTLTPNIVAFTQHPGLAESSLLPGNRTIVLYGNGENPEVIRSVGISDPRAIFVTYDDHSRVISATARLRSAFPDTSIYARASKRREALNLQLAGATEAVVECDELARAVPLLMKGKWDGPIEDSSYDPKEDFRYAASIAANIPLSIVDELFELYESLDYDKSGLLGREELIQLFRKTKKGFVSSDDDIKMMERWLQTSTSAHMDPMDKIEFCRLYARAPSFVKESFGIIRKAKATK